jgi:hypothetical protein
VASILVWRNGVSNFAQLPAISFGERKTSFRLAISHS